MAPPGSLDVLLDAALAALASDGPAFRVEAAASRAGASKALYFHHFGSREGLLDAMAARVLSLTQDGLDRLVADYPAPRARLEALARALLQEPGEPPAEARHVLQFWMLDDATGGCRALLRDALVADFLERTTREARHGAAAGAVADLVLGAWHGATVRYASGRPVDFDREQERLVDALARLIGA
jgi:AcrR family transcriptional regulator